MRTDPQEAGGPNGSVRQVRLGRTREAAGPTGRGKAPGLHSRKKGFEQGTRGLVYV